MKVKVLNTRYTVKLDGLDSQSFESLKEARDHVKSLAGSSSINRVDIVRQNMSETHIDSYVPKTTTVFVASELGNDLGADDASTDATN